MFNFTFIPVLKGPSGSLENFSVDMFCFFFYIYIYNLILKVAQGDMKNRVHRVLKIENTVFELSNSLSQSFTEPVLSTSTLGCFGSP